MCRIYLRLFSPASVHCIVCVRVCERMSARPSVRANVHGASSVVGRTRLSIHTLNVQSSIEAYTLYLCAHTYQHPPTAVRAPVCAPKISMSAERKNERKKMRE